MRRGLAAIVLLLAIIPILAGTSCAPQEKIPLVVFIAGSLMIPFDSIEKAYEDAHPEIDMQVEAHGSIQVIRHVTDIHEKIDVVASADHDLIPLLMYRTKDMDTGRPYADWYVEFATNHLSLAYTAKSKYASEINADNWYEIITRPGVKVGLPDPRFDACGYRALMALQLAESYYGKPAIFEDFTVGRFKMPITIKEENGRSTIHVPEIVDSSLDSGVVIRGASMQTIALLESGDMDYAFDYESVISQHNLLMVKLPEEVDLGTEKLASHYGQVQINLDFQRFAKVKPEFKGGVIGYGVTIPTNAPHPEKAREFVAFLLGPEGRKIMTENHHPLILPARASNRQSMPPELQKLCVAFP